MTIQISVRVQNAQLDVLETTIGTAPILRVLSGAPPTNCAATQTGTLLAALTLPSDWLANAVNNSKTLQGTWSGTASAAGTAGYFRIYDSSGTNCDFQGTITATGAGGDMTVDSTALSNGQTFSVTSFTLAEGNS